MSKIPLVDLKAQYLSIKDEIDGAIQRVIDSTDFINGPAVREFEEAFAEFCGARFAIGISSGTDALHLSLLGCGVELGDEVITVAHTFTATGEAIVHCGAKPIFVDIDPETYTMDPKELEKAITPRTKAIIPVHLYGQAAEMDEINAIAQIYHLPVIEDAAQAHGALYKGKPVGTLGMAACFSFYPGKNLGAYGDGGAIVTNDENFAQKMRILRDHGRIAKYEHKTIGYGNRLDTVQAAILLTKLAYLKEWTKARRNIAKQYNELLAETNIGLPIEASNRTHVYHLYVIRTDNRDRLYNHLKNNGVGAGIHYPVPLHQQKAYEAICNGLVLPNTELISKQIISLPIYPELTADAINHVVQVLLNNNH